jgi:predicted porin
MNNKIILIVHTTLLSLCMSLLANAQSLPVDAKVLEELQTTILQQQEQLKIQAEQIRLQSERLDAMQLQIRSLQQPEQTTAAPLSPPATAQKKTHATQLMEKPPLLTVFTPDERIKLNFSGQVNRALNVVNDGGGTDLYHVDNNTSNSRIRVIGTGKINEELSVGTRIEVAIAPDISSQVSQTNQTPGTYFDQRWTEVSLTSRSYGKLSMGKGDTASNNTAEVDLSKTDMIQCSSISDIDSALLFREKTGKLTTLKIGDVFNNRDGLSRQSRLRYDTPTLNGFSLAASLVTNQRSDLALYWSGEGNGFKAAGAAAVANPRLADSGLQYDGSLSILQSSTGLNLTLSGGLLERDQLKDAINLYGKIGWIADFTDLGSTAFGVDYTWAENLPSSRDSAWSVGGAIVQSFTKMATELYLQYRLHTLDRTSGPAVDNINVGTVGARIKF